MGKQLVNKIRGMNPLARRGTLLLLALLVSFACLIMPRSSEAAVTVLTNWKNTAGTAIAGTTYFRGTTALPGATNAYGAIAAGTNRLMVVSLCVNTSVAQTALVPTVSYGGQTFSVATTDIATNSRQHTWLFYLKETQIQAAVGTTLSFTYTGNAGLVYTGVYANAAVYNGVDQGTPYQYQTTFNSGATTSTIEGPLPVSQVVVAGDYAVEINDSLRTGSSTAPTVTLQTGWTSRGSTTRTGTTPAAYAMRCQTAYRSTVGTWTSQHTASVAVLNSISAMTLKQAVVPGIANGVTMPALDVWASDADKAVDSFTVTGGGTITGFTITGNATTTTVNVSKVTIYRKVGTTNTILEGTDQIVGSVLNPTFPVTVAANEPVVNGAYYIITYGIAAGAQAIGTSTTLTGRVTAITSLNGGLGTINDTASGTLTVLPTTSIIDTGEPAAVRLKNGSAATLLDAFSVKHTGVSPTDDDTVTNVTVTLGPQYISGGSAATLSKIKKVEIVNAAQTQVYGSMTAATTGDTWNIPLNPPFIITSSPVTYYVRISTADGIIPSNNDPSCVGSPTACTGYFGVTGTITGFLHTQSNNKAVITDTASQTLAIDFEEPGNASAFTAKLPIVSDPNGTINLTWSAAVDPHSGSLHPSAPYKIVRGAANGGVPNPHCIDGTDISTVGATINKDAGTATDVGLISTQSTQYKYRICSVDSLGNISNGVTANGIAKVNSVCTNPPIIRLSPDTQIIKSAGSSYSLSLANMDTGVCSDVVFSLALVSEGGSNPAHFIKSFPTTITLGTGGAGASTGGNALITISAAGSAVQLESYQFAVQVSSPGNSHGLPQTTPIVTGLLNDMPSIVHNSANMNKYTYGGWGQTYTCATCHSNSTTNIKGVYQLISTPIGRRNVVFTKTSSVATDYIGVFSNDNRTVKNGSTQVCSVCHHKTRQHQYSASKPFGGPANDEPYVSNHNNSRDCMTCHTHNTAFRSITGTCGDCHGSVLTAYAPVDQLSMVKNVTNALGPLPPNYGAHTKHSKAQVGCGACHSNTNHGLLTAGWVGDSFLEMGFTINSNTFTPYNPNPAAEIIGGTFYGTSNINYPFDWEAAPGTTIVRIGEYTNSCVTYCHGNWTGNAGNGSQQQPIWVGDGNEIICGSCHYATSTTPPPGGSHIKHAGSTGAGIGIACDKCHKNVFNTFTGAAHINGKVRWDLSGLTGGVGGAKYNGAPSGETTQVAGATTYGQCSNMYCHSSVQSGNGSGVPLFYAQPVWGGTVACGDCHAQPNRTGSHDQHEGFTPDGIAFDCHVCHNNGGTTAPVNHANGYINFEFNGLGANTVYTPGTNVPAGTAFGKCNTSNCHGRFERAWGTTSSGYTLCDKCHGSATSSGGFYGTKGPGSSVFYNESGVGLHDIHIQNPNSPRKSTFASFTSFATGLSCKQCHYSPKGPFTAGHIDTSLPAETGFDHMSSIAKNGDTFGYYSSPTFNSLTKTCNNIWCHGAGMNSNRARGPYAGTTPPGLAAPKWNVPQFTGNRVGDCNMCHALPPQAPNSTYTHFGKTLAQCNECHLHLAPTGISIINKKLHVNGSIDGGCGGCHGNPPITADISIPANPNNTGIAVPAQNALAAGQAGAHNSHILIPAIGQNCYTCHGGYSMAMPSNNLEIGFRGFSSQYGMVKTGTFLGYSGPLGNPKWKSTSVGTVRTVSSVSQDVTCSNLYCHGGGSTNPVRAQLGGGIMLTPNWTGSTLCGDCHGVDNANAPTGGSHQRHALTVASLNCETCHGVVADNGTHVNAAVSWKLDRSNLAIGASATYNNTSSGTLRGLAPRNAGTDYRRCNNVYCHSTVQGPTGVGFGTYSSKQWSGGATLGCNGCHKDPATNGTAPGGHVAHANISTGMAYACGICHHEGGNSTVLHADNYVYVNFTASIGGSYATSPASPGKPAGSAVYTTCSATKCHGSISPAWAANSATPRCEKCHGYRINSPAWRATDGATATTDHRVGVHFSHISSTTYKNSKPYSCLECHSDSISLSTDNVKATAHFNGASSAKVNWGTGTRLAKTNGRQTPAYNQQVKLCSNVYCHGDGMNSNTPGNTYYTSSFARMSSPVWKTQFTRTASVVGNGSTTPGSGDCARCHGYPPMNPDHALKTASQCVNCHVHVDNTGTGFKNAALHVDGIVQASGHSFPYRGTDHMAAAGLTPWSACNTCHTTSGTTNYPIVRGSAPDCTGCHKRPSNETTYGLRAATGTNSCYDCHGSTRGAIGNYSGARPNGSMFPNISGSHTRHVINQAMVCNDCHYGAGTGKVAHGFGNHSAHDYKFVNVSSSNRKFVFTWTGGLGKGTCTNTCHVSAEWGVTKFGCNSCHSYDSTDSWTSTYGVEGIGAHKKHIAYIKTRWNQPLTPATDKFDSGAAVVVCGVCHVMNSANHSMSKVVNTRSITINTARNFGGTATYNGLNGASSSLNPKSCSNTDCHYRTSPIWSTY